MDCIFCRIIAGEVPNYTVYETEHVLAFLDIEARAKGHTLVIPKVHAKNILELDDTFVPELFLAVKEVTKKIKSVLHPDGFNIGWNQDEAGGQAVPHLHVHILPRWQSDGGSNMHAIVNHPGSESVADIAKKF